MKPREHYEHYMKEHLVHWDSALQRYVPEREPWRMIIELLLDIREAMAPPSPVKTTIEYIEPYPPKTLEQKLKYVHAWIAMRNKEGIVEDTLIQILIQKKLADRVQAERLLSQLRKSGAIYQDAHNGRLYAT